MDVSVKYETADSVEPTRRKLLRMFKKAADFHIEIAKFGELNGRRTDDFPVSVILPLWQKSNFVATGDGI
jgi:hypothetical protein